MYAHSAELSRILHATQMQPQHPGAVERLFCDPCHDPCRTCVQCVLLQRSRGNSTCTSCQASHHGQSGCHSCASWTGACAILPGYLLPVTVALVRTAREPLSHARSRTAASSQANTLGPKCSLNWKARQGWKNAMPARAPLSASNSALQNLKCIVQPTRLHHPAFLQALPIGRKRGKPAIDLVNLPPAWWLVVGNSEPVSPGGAQQEGTGCPYVGAGNTP
jgi:hypothetical protein